MAPPDAISATAPAETTITRTAVRTMHSLPVRKPSNINVAPGAVLDAQSAPSTITVGHNVTAAAGSLLGLGCQPTNTIGMFAGVPCAADPAGHTTITVAGNVTATDADTVLMRRVTVGGNVTLTGGGGE